MFNFAEKPTQNSPNNVMGREEKILKFWQEKKIFEKTLEKNKSKKAFVFYDGPPFATGTPHYGHLLQSLIKDAMPRYKTMQGFYVGRQWGWDCHGLPIENIVEKELGTRGKKEIVAMGVKKFNDLCRDKIFTFINEWEKMIPRFGRWVDMKNSYRTMDFEYMQKEWWAFKELYKKGLIYEDYRSMHICPRCETTLSQGEVAEGYKEIKDLSVTVKLKVILRQAQDKKIQLPENTYFLAWTTTPWTLPGNVALAVGEKIKYVAVKVGQDNDILKSIFIEKGEEKKSTTRKTGIYIIAESKIGLIPGDKEIIKTFLGSDLVGLEYEPLFDYYAKDKNLKNRENGWKVMSADFVTTDDGTGIVHIAPAFGSDDMKLGRDKKLPFVQHVKMDGTFKEENDKFSGLDLKPRAKDKPEEIREADLAIVKYLEEKELVFAYEKYEHSYPHCWRCDTALLNYATSSWFVAVEKVKPILLKTAKNINWSPAHIKEGRFGQWLEGARDWSISRQRFWANTVPVWRCSQCKKEMVFASAEELEKESKQKISDLHKDIVDQVIFNCNCGGKMIRVPDVLDTWFDSGSVPFATQREIPADYIGEAQDQTRAWFYYMHVLVGALFKKQAFKNCIVTGIVLAEDGKKMSKKFKNYLDPTYMIEKYGADPMRFYMLSSPVVQAENLSFSEKGVDEVAKKNIGRLQNVLSFYQLYQDQTLASNKSKNILDLWILSRLNELIKDITNGYESYRVDLATRPITNFIDDFSVWYLRRSRDRFKEEGAEKTDALSTLRYVLYNLSLVMAPCMPFLSEHIFQAVKEDSQEESVHLCNWPKAGKIDQSLLSKMQEARDITSQALSARVEKGIKVKQPLALLEIQTQVLSEKDSEAIELIKDEVNIKKIIVKKEKLANGLIGIKLDFAITEELKDEGVLREIIRQLQGKRKEQGLVPTDKIDVKILAPEYEKNLIEKNKEFLLREFRAIEIKTENGEDITIKINIIK